MLNEPLEVSVVPGAMSSVPDPVTSRPEPRVPVATVRSAPLMTTSLAALPSAESPATCSVPLETVTVPVKALAAPSASVPAPVFVIPDEPDSAALIVAVDAAATESRFCVVPPSVRPPPPSV